MNRFTKEFMMFTKRLTKPMNTYASDKNFVRKKPKPTKKNKIDYIYNVGGKGIIRQ